MLWASACKGFYRPVISVYSENLLDHMRPDQHAKFDTFLFNEVRIHGMIKMAQPTNLSQIKLIGSTTFVIQKTVPT